MFGEACGLPEDAGAGRSPNASRAVNDHQGPTRRQRLEGALVPTRIAQGRNTREKPTEIRRFITGVVAPHAVLQPKGRWIKHLNTQLSSVESTLDVISDYIDA
ncbi:hypothetical protein [Streptomyces sp. IMTB 1903]|uniref:hypothetical protein n=1 Tax=Streptomyces sp. IMTB 1903 TaxID=1776680 RepID=UPI00099E6971|nr:hypothetical protein [Streptomyces sp. IMTB 1903]